MVLAGRQGRHIFAIAHDDEAGFLALQKLLDHDPRHGLAVRAFVVRHTQHVLLRARGQHEFNRFMRLAQRHGHHHALAGCQAIGLDNDGRTLFIDIGVRCSGIGEGLVFGGRNAVALHESLGESFGAFQLRCGLGRAKNAQPVGPEFVHDAGGQWLLGANHRQCYLVRCRPLAQRLYIRDVDVFKPRIQRCTAIAGGYINRLYFGRLRQFPCQGMFAATTTDYQNFHAVLSFLNVIQTARRCEKRPACHPDLPAHQADAAFLRLHRPTCQSRCQRAW